VLFKTQIASNRALALQLLGWPDRALKSAEQGLANAHDAKNLFSLGMALTGWLMLNLDAAPLLSGGRFRGAHGDPEIVLVKAEQAVALSEENGFSEWLSWGHFAHGWALAELGQPGRGIAEMETAVAAFDHMGRVPFQPFGIALLAQTYARNGRSDQGLMMLDETLDHIERTGEKIDQAEILRLKGEVLLIRDHAVVDNAEASFRSAIEVARGQEGKWWELRSSVSLARLLRDTHRGHEARTMLSGIYNWFTEGFELPDLKEAKELLEQLNG
jgi:predicted ATPase